MLRPFPFVQVIGDGRGGLTFKVQRALAAPGHPRDIYQWRRISESKLKEWQEAERLYGLYQGDLASWRAEDIKTFIAKDKIIS